VKIRSSLALLTLVYTAHAAELKPETLKAWKEYIQSANVRIQDYLRPTDHFLQIDKDQDSVRRIRSGEVLVSPAGLHGVRKVPSGLIHDWLGDTFIAHATLKDVLSVVSDYDRYKEFYRPTVIDSRALARRGREDSFSMVVMNKLLFLKSALDSSYKCSSIRVSDRRWFTVCETTRVQEIENYGAADEHTLPEGEGDGFIWRLFSITRFEERDGGVYIELEAIALSRDIPISLRWIVEPIVRRISRNSLETSLRQTERAVHSSAALSALGTLHGSCSTPARYVSGSDSSAVVHSLRGAM
jgi:hypothetical protein